MPLPPAEVSSQRKTWRRAVQTDSSDVCFHINRLHSQFHSNLTSVVSLVSPVRDGDYNPHAQERGTRWNMEIPFPLELLYDWCSLYLRWVSHIRHTTVISSYNSQVHHHFPTQFTITAARWIRSIAVVPNLFLACDPISSAENVCDPNFNLCADAFTQTVFTQSTSAGNIVPVKNYLLKWIIKYLKLMSAISCDPICSTTGL